jgi:hypothetical protein
MLFVLGFILGFASIAAVGIAFAWPAWHVAKRWGQWGLASAWFTASMILAALFARVVDRRMTMMGLRAEHRAEYASYAKILALMLIPIGAVALVIDYKQRRGETLFTIRTALLCAAMFLAGSMLALIVNRIAYMLIMGI